MVTPLLKIYRNANQINANEKKKGICDINATHYELKVKVFNNGKKLPLNYSGKILSDIIV